MSKKYKFESYQVAAFIVSILLAICLGIAILGISSTYKIASPIIIISGLYIMMNNNKSKREELKAKLDARKAEIQSAKQLKTKDQ